MNRLEQLIQENRYQGYAYSYPHKMAYRPFSPGLDMEDLWKNEKKDASFLYVHIPFCEMRCGFCNLFTMANPNPAYEHPYLNALERQAETMASKLGTIKIAQVAIGGGTPTFLSAQDLKRLFTILEKTFGYQAGSIPLSIELSPKTTNTEKLNLLKKKGTTRASIGIQSFIEAETKMLGRPQKITEIHQALQGIKDSKIACLNIDLIYGPANQTPDSWIYSLEQTLNYEPEEVFLYPLYVRPLTGLGVKNKEWDDFRYALYLQGRDFLLNHGYTQVNMRCFRKLGYSPDFGNYCSMEDPMLGLGVGARSYTKAVHYSSDYAVGRKGVKQIIQDYNDWDTAEFSKAWFGIRLEEAEQKRRYIIKALLEYGSLNYQQYKSYFGTDASSDLPNLEILIKAEQAYEKAGQLYLNPRGVGNSDAIGPWLYSNKIVDRMDKYDLV